MCEYVVCVDHLIETECMCAERLYVDLSARHQIDEHGDGGAVDQPGRHRDVGDPEIFQVQGDGLAMNTEVGNVSPGSDQLGAQFEGRRHPDRLDDDVGPQSVREFHDAFADVLTATVDGLVRTETGQSFQPGLGQVDGDHRGRAVQPGGTNGRQPNGPCADHHHGVTRFDLSVLHA